MRQWRGCCIAQFDDVSSSTYGLDVSCRPVCSTLIVVELTVSLLHRHIVFCIGCRMIRSRYRINCRQCNMNCLCTHAKNSSHQTPPGSADHATPTQALPLRIKCKARSFRQRCAHECFGAETPAFAGWNNHQGHLRASWAPSYFLGLGRCFLTFLILLDPDESTFSTFFASLF